MSQGANGLAVAAHTFAHVQNTTSRTVDGFRAGHTGALAKITTVTGLPSFAASGMEGIAAV
ncbi:hypothetical protein [Streptomyces pseudovenezuelae]|uniref:Uncharacterized protein n=1 Tax=Streptomyces pseudovenezuelae TaxID=67350 RepID=A0ABT6LDV7_9ACTN|nr:hypothetical protein [Streptomyces pseudovenezuelae]MDH6214487.1 hypothetical protein [Streptomyces pseudovenezuelae]